MILATRRKAIYLVVAAMTVLLLLGTPSAMPSAFADCSGASGTVCPD
jgi:hypothetical protein